jgi:hypothetical protein
VSWLVIIRHNEITATKGDGMGPSNSSSADSSFETVDNIDDAELARVMRTVPLGAGVLAGTAVALLVIGWLLIYLLVFVPRGTVG